MFVTRVRPAARWTATPRHDRPGEESLDAGEQLSQAACNYGQPRVPQRRAVRQAATRMMRVLTA